MTTIRTSTNAAIVIDDQGSAPAIAINWFLGVPIVNRSSKQVVVQSYAGLVYGEGTGELYVTDLVGGAKVTNPAQRMWASQFNAEGHPVTDQQWQTAFNLHVDAGRVRIFGWKDEGSGWAGKLFGGITEVVGFLQYDNPCGGCGGAGSSSLADPPEFVVNNAAFSLANRSYVAWASTPQEAFYPVLVQETRGTETRQLLRDNGGHQYGLFTAYRPEDLNVVRTARRAGPAAASVPAGVTASNGTVRIDVGRYCGMSVQVRMLDIQGRAVETRVVVPHARDAGLVFDGLTRGAYVAQIVAGGRTQAESVAVAR